MKRFITIVLGISLTFTSLMYAQDSITPEGVNEVIRRGNHIEIIDGTQGSDLVGDAMAPPEDDSHKWFISVITSANCKYCELLKNDIINDKFERMSEEIISNLTTSKMKAEVDRLVEEKLNKIKKFIANINIKNFFIN
jgi:thioredoxin-related protein